MQTRFLILCIFSTLVLSCSKPAEIQSLEETSETAVEEQNSQAPNAENASKLPTGDHSQNSADWPGTYFATLPCASCEGIETWVTLNPDGSFVLKTHHMGLNDDREEIYTGKFTWDDSGSIVTLNGLIGGAPGKYKVGENRIWHLDRDGKQIQGDLADRYILTKE